MALLKGTHGTTLLQSCGRILARLIMVYFKRDEFAGIAPGVSSRLLGEQFGQIAENIDFESRALVATTTDSDTHTLQAANRNSIFYYDSTNWLEWDEDGVFVVPGPVPDDEDNRLYWTGAGTFPQMGTYDSIVSGTSGYPYESYRLGVPEPSAAPTTSVSGTPNAELTPNDVSYVYTFVTALGEEGPPSLPSTVFEMTNGQTATINMPASALPSGNYNFGNGAKKRIYRSNTGSTNTQFQFVKEVTIATTSTTDNASAENLGEVLPSTTWIGPPNDDTSLYPDGPLQGLIPLAMGTMAGFTGKRFCLSEPFLPHAWPITYRITVENDIVAIASTSGGAVALTDGQPYFITGTDPSAMTAVKVELAQACVNAKSVVDMGSYVLYAGPDGLCAVENSQGRVVTRNQVSAKQWNTDFNPTTIRAFKHEGTYVAFHAGGGWVYDPRRPEASLSTLTLSTDVQGGYHNPKDGQLYVIVGNKIRKYRGGTASKTLKFKSKKFVTTSPISMGWVCVQAEEYPVTVKVWGDGTLVSHYVLSKSGDTFTQATTVPSGISNGTLQEPVMRMPAVIAQEWEIQVEGTNINEFCLAQSMSEVRES